VGGCKFNPFSLHFLLNDSTALSYASFSDEPSPPTDIIISLVDLLVTLISFNLISLCGFTS
jgi:hypothetical protein